MIFHNVSVTYFYRNGSQFTEHYPKALNSIQLADKLVQVRARIAKESNIVDAELSWKKLDTRI